MKTKHFLSVCALISFLFIINTLNTKGQDTIEQRTQMLDLKLKLLDSKLELLDSKIKVWEAKPEELNQRLYDIDSKIKTLEFQPEEINSKFGEIYSQLQSLQNSEERLKKTPTLQFFKKYQQYVLEYKSAIMLNPVRLYEGTFHITWERIINNKFSINLSGLITYATEGGFANYFITRNQYLAYFDESTNSYIDYTTRNITGLGGCVKGKNYLFSKINPEKKAPIGLYAAPQLMYRRIWITGNKLVFEDDEWVEKEIKQYLNVFAGGVILGTKISFLKVLAVDLYVGGNIRLCKYDNESDFTKYKGSKNIDYSGIAPTFGISVGILR